MKRALLAIVAAAALLVALPAAEPASAQERLSGDSCTAVVLNSRVISSVSHDGVVERRQIQQTVVDRCARIDGTTYDSARRYVTFWQQLV